MVLSTEFQRKVSSFGRAFLFQKFSREGGEAEGRAALAPLVALGGLPPFTLSLS